MFGLSQSEKNNALYAAVDRGDAAEINRLIAKGGDPNLKTYNYGPLLFRAISQYRDTAAHACVMALLEGGADVNATDNNGWTALHFILYRNGTYVEAIKALITAGADVNRLDNYKSTPLIIALSQKAWAGADVLLDCMTGQEAAGGANREALFIAVNHGAPRKMLNRLTGKISTDVNLRYSDEKQTALFAAVANGHQKTVEWLLTFKGINVNLANAKKETPLQVAVTAGRIELVKMLLAAGANPNTRNEEGHAPLTTAARANSQEIVEALIAAKAELDAPEKGGMTALTIAAQAGSIRLVRTLLAAAEAANVKLVLEPALFAAAENGNGRVLELLIGAGADVNAADKDGRTPLMKAAGTDSTDSLAILIKAGAKPDTADRNGMFAYDFAVTAKKMKAKEFLGRYRPEEPKKESAAAPADYHYVRLNDHSLEVREGEGLTMTFNFWTQQVIFRDTERPAPVTIQNFADLQRQEAVDEAYQKLKDLGGNPPDPHLTSLKKAPGLGK